MTVKLFCSRWFHLKKYLGNSKCEKLENSIIENKSILICEEITNIAKENNRKNEVPAREIRLKSNINDVAYNSLLSIFDNYYLLINAPENILFSDKEGQSSLLIQELYVRIEKFLNEYSIKEDKPCKSVKDDLLYFLNALASSVSEKYSIEIKVVNANSDNNMVRTICFPPKEYPRVRFFNKDTVVAEIKDEIGCDKFEKKSLFKFNSQNTILIYVSKEKYPDEDINRYMKTGWFDGGFDNQEYIDYIVKTFFIVCDDEGKIVACNDETIKKWREYLYDFDKFFLCQYLFKDEKCFDKLQQSIEEHKNL